MARLTSMRSRSLLLGALTAGVALAGCGSVTSATNSTDTATGTPTVAPTGATGAAHGSSTSTRGGSREPTTPEEKHEYDANEGRCRADGGTVRDVGTIDAYCAFPTRSDDFHLIETSQKAVTEDEE